MGIVSNSKAIFNEKNTLCDIYQDGEIKASLAIINNLKKAPATSNVVILKRANAKETLFVKDSSSNIYNSTLYDNTTLTKKSSGYEVKYKDDTIEEYDNSGKLLSITNGVDKITLLYDKKGRVSKATNIFDQSITLKYDNNTSLVKEVVSFDDKVYRYSYNRDNLLTKVTLPDNSTIAYEYDSFNNLTAIKDANGNIINQYSYDNQNRVVSVSGADGANKEEFKYDSSNTTVTKNSLDTIYNYTLIKSKLLLSVVNTPNGDEIYSYDNRGYKSSYINNLGVKTLYTYNKRGLLVSQTNKAGTKDEEITLISYDDRVNKPTKVVKAGVATFYSYNNKGLLTKKITGSVNPANYRLTREFKLLDRPMLRGIADVIKETSYDYNDKGLPTKTTLPNGAETKAKFDKSGNPIEQTNTLGFETKSEFDKSGRPIKIVDANGVETTKTYDAMGRVISSTTNSKTTKYEYDKAGHLIKTIYPDGLETYTKYDSRGNVVESGDNQGNKTINKYDNNNNLVETKTFKDDKLILSSKSTYNSKNQLIEQIDSFGNKTTYTYNSKGQKISQKDKLGRETKYEYDSLGRLIKTINPDNTTTTYSYDKRGNRVEIVTPNKATFKYSYDPLNRVTSKINPDRGTTKYTYDVSDNIIKEEYANGNTKELTYDKANRVTSITYSNQNQTLTIDYTYDEGQNAKGKLTTITDPSGSTHFEYDKDGNIITKTKTIDNQTFTQSYTYNDKGKLISQIYPSGKTIDYTYNQKGELESISIDNTPFITNIKTNQLGLIEYSYSDGTKHTREYDRNGRVVKLTYPNYTQDITYDSVNNIIKLTVNNQTKHFNYDLLDRLTKYELNATNYQRFSYDANGNRLSLNQEINKTIRYTIKPNTNILQTIEHIKRVDINHTQIEQTIDYTYDKLGNIIEDANHTYSYDARNRLTKIDNNITYQYDYDNKRVSKTINNQTIYYIYDGYKLIGEYNQNGEPIKEYLYYNNTPIAVITPTNTYKIYSDHLNTPRRVADQNNKIVWEWESKPFGESKPNEDVDNDGNKFTLNLRFPGQYYDAETNKHYNINRDYDPVTGRYIQSDPIGFEGGSNSYLYSGANPVIRFDESGLNWKEKFLKGLASFGKSKVDNLLSTALYNATKSTKKIKVYDKDGTFNDAIKDFNNLPLSDKKVINQNGKTLYIGFLADGRTVIARTGSHEKSGNVPTLEIQQKNLKIKIRYIPKLPFSDKPLGTGFGPIDTFIGAIIDEF